MTSRIFDWNPADGQAFQGDVSIIPIPKGVKVSTADEIKPVDGRLIIQEGEATGHHHAIALPSRNFRPAAELGDPVLKTRSPRLARTFGSKAKVASAHLYRDASVAGAMQRAGILARTDLAVACLVVEDGPVVVQHEEHDGIRVPPGSYLIGRQIESAGAEERVVAD